MENYEFYYKDVWERTLESIKKEEAFKIKEEDFYYFNGSRLYGCNDKLATISTPLEIGSICLNSYKEIIAAHLSKILNKDLQIYIAPEKTLMPNKSEIENYQTLIKTKVIDSEQSFANFVIGKSNSQAHVAALTVATNPGLTYNPLFIYGNSGLGKTHLLMAVANRVRESDNNKKIIYIGSGLDFVEAVAEASKNKSLNQLKQSFYDADLLIVDDIQFLKGNKEKSQEIFFSIFTELVNNKKQICLAADKKPEDIEGLEERITTRFNAGLVVPILAPEYE
ncbi:MAG: DnaA/Hda family protein, partial [Bacteroidales bacterium]|nr:DnaA/Hda family protein [Bacteroidales bacterium]